MSNSAITHPWQTALAWSAVLRAVGLSIVGFIGWLCFSSAGGAPWKAVSLVVILAVAAVAGVAWYLPRARTERRWRAALHRYAAREQAKGMYPQRNVRH